MFFGAGVLKFQAGASQFLKQVLAYDLVKGHTARLITGSLPPLEIICGLCLIFGFILPLTALFGFVLLGLFTLAILNAVLQEKQVGCGCFGNAGEHTLVRWRLVYRNLGLMGLLTVIMVYGSNRLTLDRWLFNGEQIIIPKQNWFFVVWFIWVLVVIGLNLFAQQTVKRNLGRHN
jgi:uncharacterized membrane protein YphA (DoxX/SURF4 family)